MCLYNIYTFKATERIGTYKLSTNIRCTTYVFVFMYYIRDLDSRHPFKTKFYGPPQQRRDYEESIGSVRPPSDLLWKNDSLFHLFRHCKIINEKNIKFYTRRKMRAMTEFLSVFCFFIFLSFLNPEQIKYNHPLSTKMSDHAPLAHGLIPTYTDTTDYACDFGNCPSNAHSFRGPLNYTLVIRVTTGMSYYQYLRSVYKFFRERQTLCAVLCIGFGAVFALHVVIAVIRYELLCECKYIARYSLRRRRMNSHVWPFEPLDVSTQLSTTRWGMFFRFTERVNGKGGDIMSTYYRQTLE